MTPSTSVDLQLLEDLTSFPFWVKSQLELLELCGFKSGMFIEPFVRKNLVVVFTKLKLVPLNQEILNSDAINHIHIKNGTWLLPQAFPEGCPLHPAYGSGHATVAGATITILKAWFDGKYILPAGILKQPSADGTTLDAYLGGDVLTIEGELNKIASNIAQGRCIAGVHWRSDSDASLKLGEEVAIKLLEDQKPLFNENFAGFTFYKFDGTKVTV